MLFSGEYGQLFSGFSKRAGLYTAYSRYLLGKTVWACVCVCKVHLKGNMNCFSPIARWQQTMENAQEEGKQFCPYQILSLLTLSCIRLLSLPADSCLHLIVFSLPIHPTSNASKSVRFRKSYQNNVS